MGVPLVAGRGLAHTDRRVSPGVCVVDESFVRRYAPEGSPLGRRIVTRTSPKPTSNPLDMMQRQGEFGVRAALGAQPEDLRKLVFAQGARVGALGIALGVVVAVVAGRVLQSQLYGVVAGDPVTIASAAMVLLLVVVGSTVIPAIRASRVDASRMLRG